MPYKIDLEIRGPLLVTVEEYEELMKDVRTRLLSVHFLDTLAVRDRVLQTLVVDNESQYEQVKELKAREREGDYVT